MTVSASDGITIVEDSTPTPAPTDSVVVHDHAPEVNGAEPEPAVAPSDNPGENIPGNDTPTSDDPVPAEDAEPAKEPWVHSPGWKYDWIEYKGDRLAVRVPNGAALASLNAASSCSDDFQTKLVDQFVAAHISPESYEHVIERMADPDDTEYASVNERNDLIAAVLELGTERAKAEAEALAEAAKAGK